MPKTVAIYIGFMEEEISPLLKSLLNKYKAVPVRAISRGPIDPKKQLFEQDFSYYGVENPTCFVAKADSGKLEDEVAENLRIAFFQGDKSAYLRRVVPRILKQDRKKEGKNEREQKVSEESAALSVVYLDNNKVADQDNGEIPIACYVVQSPEMGKQPSIVRAYLRAIFKAILVANPGAKVRIVTVGAGGGIPMGIEAGQPVKLGASIFIGAEQDENGKRYGVVDIAGIVPLVEGKEIKLKPLREDFTKKVLAKAQEKDDDIDVEGFSLPLFRAEVWPPLSNKETSYDQIEVAERLATAVVTGKTLKELESITKDTDPYYGVKLFLDHHPLDEDDRDDFKLFQEAFATIVQELGNEYENISKALNYAPKDYYRISASWSYFDQKEEKDAVWHQLGKDSLGNDSHIVANSNMEDYHVFRVLESILADQAQAKYPELVDFSTIRVTANPNASDKAIGLLKTWLASEPKYTIDDWIDSIHWGLKGCPTEEVKDLPGYVCFWNACWTPQIEGGAKSNQLYDFIYPVVTKEGIRYALDPFCMDLAQDFLKELPKQYESFFDGLPPKYKSEYRSDAAKTVKVINRDALLTDGRTAVEKLVSDFFSEHKEYDAGKGLYYIWIRDKWNQIPNGSQVLAPGVTINDHDRMLYRSGNVFAMRGLPDSPTMMMKGAA